VNGEMLAEEQHAAAREVVHTVLLQEWQEDQVRRDFVPHEAFCDLQ
jgi:hypothetical protein